MANRGHKTEKRPLTSKQLATIEMHAYAMGGDTLKVFLLLRYTGMHISVIAPHAYADRTNGGIAAKNKPVSIKEVIDEHGRLNITWDRPKKEGAEAHCSVIKHPKINFEVVAFANEIASKSSKYQRSRQYFYTLIRDLGKESGVPELSPLSFRHSLAVEMLRNGAPQNTVCDTLNISPATLRKYGKYTPEQRNDFLAKMWGLE